ncbi:uncharacterized protein [Ranitomeya imitator]|uniref:uncharacterized protein n=1 Tax=Ranitomeya imitator TaxID=111125 RepID=UPI0037E8315A
MMKSEDLALSVEDTPSQVTGCGMVHKLNMMKSEDLVLLVEDTPSQATSCGMDTNFYNETPLSIEETPQNLNSEGSQENNSGSTGALMFGNPTIHTRQETNEDVTLCGDCDTQDHEPDHKASMNNRQYNMDLYTSPQSNSSEIFEDNSEKSKIVDATCTNDHSSMSIQQESNVSNIIRSDDHSSKSEDGTTAQPVDDNLALRVDGATEVFESEQNGKEPCKPNDDILAHHKVNNIFSTADDCDRNASTLKPDGYIYTELCTNTAPNKKQGGGNMCEDETIDSADKRSPDHGEDINELLYRKTSIKEADAQKKISKVFDDFSPSDSSSTDLHLQDSNVTKIISPDNSTMDSKPEESSAVGNEMINFVSEGQRSNLESVDNDDVGYESIHDICHEVTKSLSADNHTDKNVSSITSDESTDIKASNISTCRQLQGGGDVDTKEPEDIVSMSSSSTQEVIGPVDELNKSCIPIISSPEGSSTLRLAADVPKSKKHRKKAFASKQNNNVNCKPNDDKQANNRVTGAGKTEANASIDVGCNKTTNISKRNNGTSLGANPGRRRGNKKVQRNNSPKNDHPEDKPFLGNVLSFLKPKSQHRSQPIENRPNVFDTTGSTCSQHHGDVLTKERSPDEKSRTMNRGLWKWDCFSVLLISFILLCSVVNPVEGKCKYTGFITLILNVKYVLLQMAELL